ncbi:MAG: ATP-binding protein [Bacteroidales bacterium]|nr:ATP-binding protein [Bacteroidales bacterium]MCL2739429.1 ATP-binding protein [Bacteroidales bacterium]
MAIALKGDKKPITLTTGLFAYFFGLSLLFGCILVLFHFFYERHYKIQTLNSTLEHNTLLIHNYLRQQPIDSVGLFTDLLDKNLRITIIGASGEVWYDNDVVLEQLDNHLQRPEIKEANQKGRGAYVRRSPTTQIEYYYFAKKFDTYYVRVALPYIKNASRLISPGYFFSAFTLILLCLLAAGLFFVRSRLGKRLSGTQLEQERLIRQELTQNLSHELKTPVSSILGYMETLALKPDLEPDKLRFFIERSYVQTQRLSRLIEDISLLNRLDHAPERIPFESIDLFDIIENVVKDVSLQLFEHHIAVAMPPRQTLWINGNSSLLYSIFRNLFDNVLAYAGPHTTISISWIDKGDPFLYFSFSDNGPGITPEHLPHLFDRFYRVDSGRSRKQGGTGLGLSIVKNGIMAHGGSIEAHTGSGLTFSFKIRK